MKTKIKKTLIVFSFFSLNNGRDIHKCVIVNLIFNFKKANEISS